MPAKIHPIDRDGVRAEVDFRSLQFKVEVYQRINRAWAHELDPYESRVLLALVDRTIGWGDAEVQCSTARLLNGDKVCGPLNISRRSLFRALASLEQKGFIKRRHPTNDPEKTFYSVNPNRSLNMAPDLPKRLQIATRCNDERVPHGHSPVPEGHQPVPDRHSIYSNHLTGNLSTGNQGVALADHGSPEPEKVIREIVATTVDRHAAARSAKREKQEARSSAAGVEAAWRQALAETFPDAVEPAWTGREKGQAKRLISGWIHGKQISFIDFTDWAVRNWTQIMRKQFKWMTQSPPPAIPAFGFFAAMTNQFAECWAEGKLEEWASAKERTEIEAMMARGMTFEQATLQHAKNNVARGLREEMREREIKVRARSRAADQKLEQAKKLADFSGAAPMHPRSPAAMEMLKRSDAKPAPALGTPGEETFAPLSAPMVDPNRNPFD